MASANFACAEAAMLPFGTPPQGFDLVIAKLLPNGCRT